MNNFIFIFLKIFKNNIIKGTNLLNKKSIKNVHIKLFIESRIIQ